MIFEYLADMVFWKRKFRQWDDEKLYGRFGYLLGPDALWPFGHDERLESDCYDDQPFSELRALDREMSRRYKRNKREEWEKSYGRFKNL